MQKYFYYIVIITFFSACNNKSKVLLDEHQNTLDTPTPLSRFVKNIPERATPGSDLLPPRG